ncbi:MAG: hypothetical protein R3D60_02020 [Paracoccaceae bacterium]
MADATFSTAFVAPRATAAKPRRHDSDAPNWPLFVAVVLLAIWGAAIATFGLPALYLPAVIASPLMLVLLVGITRG